VTRREEKYKAEAATETFFVRGGDVLSALVVWLGTSVVPLPIEGFAAVNVVAVCLWIAVTVLIVRERRRAARHAAGEAEPLQ
jgi:AAA family ATP:ADP antiporter